MRRPASGPSVSATAMARLSSTLLGVPPGPVLIAEQHELAVAKPRLAAGVVQEHHRQQPVNLGLVRKQFGQRAAQPDCFRRQLVATAVALIEDQVNDGENGVETLAEQVNRWHAKRDCRSFDLSLGPHQPLRHRALRYQEGTGDLVGAEPPEGAQGERNLRLDSAPGGSR